MCQTMRTPHFPNSPCFHCGGTLTTIREDGEVLTFCEICAAISRRVVTNRYPTSPSSTSKSMTASAKPMPTCSRGAPGIGF